MTTTLTEKNGNSVCRPESEREQVTYAPRFDIWENQDEIVLYGDLPGVDPEGLDIHYEDGQLFIHGKVSLRHEQVNFTYGEYGIGDYQRSFSVGESINAEQITAELNHGVLVIRLPKLEQLKPRKIQVQVR